METAASIKSRKIITDILEFSPNRLTIAKSTITPSKHNATPQVIAIVNFLRKAVYSSRKAGSIKACVVLV